MNQKFPSETSTMVLLIWINNNIQILFTNISKVVYPKIVLEYHENHE
jgi:hypothetical protein